MSNIFFLYTHLIFLQETLSEGVTRDLVDTMLNLQKEAKEKNNTEELERLSDCSIGHIVYELFGGGIESTTMSILWFIIYMIRHPEVGTFCTCICTNGTNQSLPPH